MLNHSQTMTRHLIAISLLGSILTVEINAGDGEGAETRFGISSEGLVKKLRASEQRIRTLSVNIKGNQKTLTSRKAAEKGDIAAVASQFRFLQNWEVDFLGRGWNNGSGKSVFERADGTFFDREIRFESTFDGVTAKMLRIEKYGDGKRIQVGLLQSSLAWSQHSPFAFTIGRPGYSGSSLIESRNGRIIAVKYGKVRRLSLSKSTLRV